MRKNLFGTGRVRAVRIEKKRFVLFGDEEAKGIVILKSFNDYYNGYTDTDKNGNITCVIGFF